MKVGFYNQWLVLAASWSVLASVQAASANSRSNSGSPKPVSSDISPSTTVSNTSSGSTSTNAGPPMITVPIEVSYYSELNVVLTDDSGNAATVSLDYMQPHIWLINANDILNCSVVYSMFGSFNQNNMPSTVTYSGATYNVNECYVEGAYTPLVTTTQVSGSKTVTVTQTAPSATGSAYNITYPYDFYGSGNFAEGNFSLGLVGGDGSADLPLDGLSYLLANDTNSYEGAFGVAGPAWGGGMFDNLKSRDLIFGTGYSAYYFSNASADGLGGYLLIGSVDQNLYSGDFYVFPQIPHTGLGDDDAIFPILQLDSVALENLENSQQVYLYDGSSVPVVVDPTLLYSYLPREMIINLALQANAYYTPAFDAWVLNCTSVDHINAEVQFKMGPLTVPVPLSSIIESAAWDNLTFADGQQVCVFNILPSDQLGYAAFGASFLENIYMAMDNEGGAVAVAKANTQLSSTRVATSQNDSTVGYITSGHIPFATNASVSDLTMTFGSYNSSASFSDPGLLTNVVISSGHVYISQRRSSRSSVSASAADAKPTSAGAGSLRAVREKNGTVLYLVLLLGGVVGVMFL